MYSDMNPCPDPDVDADAGADADADGGAIEWMFKYKKVWNV